MDACRGDVFLLVNIRMSSNNNIQEPQPSNGNVTLVAVKPNIKETVGTIRNIANTLTTGTPPTKKNEETGKINKGELKVTIKELMKEDPSLRGPEGPQGPEGPEGPPGKDATVSQEYVTNLIKISMNDPELKKELQGPVPTKPELIALIKEVIQGDDVRQLLRGNAGEKGNKGNAGEKGNKGNVGEKGNRGNAGRNFTAMNTLKGKQFQNMKMLPSNTVSANNAQKRVSAAAANSQSVVSQLSAVTPPKNKMPQLAPSDLTIEGINNANAAAAAAAVAPGAAPAAKSLGPSQLTLPAKKAPAKPRTLGELLKSNPGEYEALSKEYQGLPNTEKPNSFIGYFKKKYGVTNTTVKGGARRHRGLKTRKAKKAKK